jgi:hypothetical protein
MEFKMRALGALAAVFSFFAVTGAANAADRAYTEGVVVNVSAIRTEPGMFDEYMKYLAGPYKQIMEEQKKAGVILAWSVYSVAPRGEHDPDVYLVTTFKNMAALDGLQDKSDPISEKIFGSMEKADAASIDRGKMRTSLGSELLREVVLK